MESLYELPPMTEGLLKKLREDGAKSHLPWPEHFNCRCGTDYTYSDQYDVDFNGNVIHTIDTEYEDVTYLRLDK
jgi:hypothetical protein